MPSRPSCICSVVSEPKGQSYIARRIACWPTASVEPKPMRRDPIPPGGGSRLLRPLGDRRGAHRARYDRIGIFLSSVEIRPAFVLRRPARFATFRNALGELLGEGEKQRSKKRNSISYLAKGSGAPDRIRTCDLWNRNPTLYPAELRVPALAMTRLSDERVLSLAGGGLQSGKCRMGNLFRRSRALAWSGWKPPGGRRLPVRSVRWSAWRRGRGWPFPGPCRG